MQLICVTVINNIMVNKKLPIATLHKVPTRYQQNATIGDLH